MGKVPTVARVVSVVPMIASFSRPKLFFYLAEPGFSTPQTDVFGFRVEPFSGNEKEARTVADLPRALSRLPTC